MAILYQNEGIPGLLPTNLQAYIIMNVYCISDKICISVSATEKHTARAIYLARTAFNIKYFSKLFEGKILSPPQRRRIFGMLIEKVKL